MRKFKFQFEAVERVRKEEQDSALRELARAQQKFRDVAARRHALQNDLIQSLLRREKLGAEPTEAAVFRLENDFIAGTKQRIIQQEQALYRASKVVEKTLRAYLSARKRARMIETLREKAYADWRKERAKKEQKDTEDLYVMRARMAALSEAS